jgi:hypothetical protein
MHLKKSKRILSIFSDESIGSFICLRRHIYMSYVNKIQPIHIKICDMYRVAEKSPYTQKIRTSDSI